MAVIINASTSSGLIQTADTSGILTLQSNGTSAASVSGSNLQFNSGYGSVATAYGCRAWVNFDGTTNTGGFCTIRGSANVSSITDNGTGNYTVNFTTAMPDVNYSVAANGGSATANRVNDVGPSAQSKLATTSVAINSINNANAAEDIDFVSVAIFR
jgi:hypothetical protein